MIDPGVWPAIYKERMRADGIMARPKNDTISWNQYREAGSACNDSKSKEACEWAKKGLPSAVTCKWTSSAQRLGKENDVMYLTEGSSRPSPWGTESCHVVPAPGLSRVRIANFT
jgi:hypothetical protein